MFQNSDISFQNIKYVFKSNLENYLLVINEIYINQKHTKKMKLIDKLRAGLKELSEQKELTLTMKFSKENKNQIQCIWTGMVESEDESIMIIYNFKVNFEDIKKRFTYEPDLEKNMNEFFNDGNNQTEKLFELLGEKYDLLDTYIKVKRGQISSNKFGF